MVEVNALGKACPLPVIETKKAIEELKQDDTVFSRVRYLDRACPVMEPFSRT